MGIGGMGIWQLLIILVIVLLLFGTKRLRGLGGDLGGAIKGFKKAVSDDNADTTDSAADPAITPKVTDANQTKSADPAGTTHASVSPEPSKTETKI